MMRSEEGAVILRGVAALESGGSSAIGKSFIPSRLCDGLSWQVARLSSMRSQQDDKAPPGISESTCVVLYQMF